MAPHFLLQPGSLRAIPVLRESEQETSPIGTEPSGVAEPELSAEDATLALLEATNRVMARFLRPVSRQRAPVVGDEGAV